MWKKPPENVFLEDNEVHIWLIDINDFIADIDVLTSFLSEEELSRSRRYYKKQLQDNFVVNRGYLRYILAKYIQVDAKDIKFDYNSKGKPFLATENTNNLQFNLSHTNNYVVYAISCLSLGIDLEKIKTDFQLKDIAKRFFTEEEYNYLGKLDLSQQTEYFFQLWTAKESYLKAIGEGLSAGLDSINLTKKIDQTQWNIEFIKSLPSHRKNWQITTFKILDNYLISLALPDNITITKKYYKTSNL